MIFKYFTYEKVTKDWLDTKIYCSICLPSANFSAIESTELYLIFHKSLTNQKLISIPELYFSVTDNSHSLLKIFTISHLTTHKRTNVARLVQLPNNTNATLNIKKSWAPVLSSSIRTGRLVFGDPPGGWGDAQAGWDRPNRHLYERAPIQAAQMGAQGPLPINLFAAAPQAAIDPIGIAQAYDIAPPPIEELDLDFQYDAVDNEGNYVI